MDNVKFILFIVVLIVILAADWSDYLPAGWVLVTHEELNTATDDAVVYSVRAVEKTCYADLDARSGSHVPIVCE
jgi:hypothetical protein